MHGHSSAMSKEMSYLAAQCHSAPALDNNKLVISKSYAGKCCLCIPFCFTDCNSGEK